MQCLLFERNLKFKVIHYANMLTCARSPPPPTPWWIPARRRYKWEKARRILTTLIVNPFATLQWCWSDGGESSGRRRRAFPITGGGGVALHLITFVSLNHGWVSVYIQRDCFKTTFKNINSYKRMVANIHSTAVSIAVTSQCYENNQNL